jgi:hypothetical protein
LFRALQNIPTLARCCMRNDRAPVVVGPAKSFFPGAPMNRSKPRSLVLAAVATLLALPAVAAIGTDEGAGIPAASHARAQGTSETPEQRERALFQDSDVSLRTGCNRITARSDKARTSRVVRLCR